MNFQGMSLKTIQIYSKFGKQKGNMSIQTGKKFRQFQN